MSLNFSAGYCRRYWASHDRAKMGEAEKNFSKELLIFLPIHHIVSVVPNAPHFTPCTVYFREQRAGWSLHFNALLLSRADLI
jgi:hypothetical protein